MIQRLKTGTLALAVLLAVLASGCGITPQKPAAPTTVPAHAGKVDYRRIEPEHTDRYQLEPGESSSGAALKLNPSPVYPGALVHESPPPTDILARLTVGRDGRVHAVYIGKYSGTDMYRQAFSDAVRQAAMTWVFTPLTLTRKVTGAGGATRMETETKPCSLWYGFHFEIVDGQPTTSSKGHQPRPLL